MLTMTNEKADKNSVEEYLHATGNNNVIDRFKLFKTLNMTMAARGSVLREIDSFLRILMNSRRPEPTKSDIIDLFIKVGVPEKIFKSKKNKSGESLDAKAVEATMEYFEFKNYLTDDELIAYKYLIAKVETDSLSSYISATQSKLKDRRIYFVDDKGWGDRDLLAINNIYTERKTGRYYASAENIVSMHMKALESFTVRDGHVMLSMDGGQMDLNCAYNMYLHGFRPEEDKIFAKEIKDRYSAMYQIVCNYIGVEPDFKFFKENRSGIKTIILAGLYGAKLPTMMRSVSNSQFCNSVRKYFDEHPGAKEASERIEKLYDLETPFSIKDYFGYEMFISNVDEYGARIPLDKLKDDIFALTCQATTGQIINKWMVSIKDELNRRDLLDEDAYVNMFRHDECAFTLSGLGIENIDVFKDRSIVVVNNWAPIHFSMNFYLHYNVPVEEEDKEYAEILTKIKNLIDKQLVNFKETPLVKLPFVRYEGIPKVYNAKVFTLKSPQGLIKHMLHLNKKRQDNIEFMNVVTNLDESMRLSGIMYDIDQGMPADTAIRKLGTLKDGVTSEDYIDLRDIFILEDKYFKGTNKFIEYLQSQNIEYCKIDTVFGDEDIFKDSIQFKLESEDYYRTLQDLRRAVNSKDIINLGDGIEMLEDDDDEDLPF